MAIDIQRVPWRRGDTPQWDGIGWRQAAQGTTGQFWRMSSTGLWAPHTLVAGDIPQLAHSSLSGLTAGDDHTQYRLESADHSHLTTGAEAGQIGYGAISAVAGTQYNPTVTQSGTVTSFTSDRCYYIQMGKAVLFYGVLVVNDAGTAAGANEVRITLPVTARFSGSDLSLAGEVNIFDTSATLTYKGIARLRTNGDFNAMSVHSTSVFRLGAADFTAALATGDIISFHGWYEAA